ncbi:hypothetical protein ABZU75_23490 [Streptosporangium sp. NPDC005286]|uniref:hypothetical protein n=1 Tax=Streptosporangium sp. NPDC005286 TaxID=3154463 RepID=UPI0033A24EA5
MADRFSDRVAGHSEALLQVNFGGQGAARLELAGLDVLPDGVSDLAVDGRLGIMINLAHGLTVGVRPSASILAYRGTDYHGQVYGQVLGLPRFAALRTTLP